MRVYYKSTNPYAALGVTTHVFIEYSLCEHFANAAACAWYVGASTAII